VNEKQAPVSAVEGGAGVCRLQASPLLVFFIPGMYLNIRANPRVGCSLLGVAVSVQDGGTAPYFKKPFEKVV
jgi:hypothetical protein